METNWEEDKNLSVQNLTFEIIREVAHGGMGKVYEAYQLGADGFKKRMAIKTIISNLTTNVTFIEMFVGEAKLVSNLIHQNIVQLYHLGKLGSSYYMAMEFVDGITLHDFVERHKISKQHIPYELSAFIISRVARALFYAHQKTDSNGTPLNLVHRDCTPKNIMIDRRGVVKLTDFGVAKAKHFLRSREGDILVGKLPYMSPEQASFNVTDARSDIFSLGIVLWEMLTKQTLFEEKNTETFLRKLKSAKVKSPAKFAFRLPRMLEEITMKCLKKNKDKRFADAAELCKALEEYLYFDRFGITDDTLAKYLRKIFPEIYSYEV